MSAWPTIGCYVRIAPLSEEADLQRRGITQWLREHDQPLATTQWFEDVEGAGTQDYPVYEALQEGVFEGRIDTVVVWSFEYMFARLKDAVGTLAVWCERDVRVVSVVHQIDLRQPASRLLGPVMLSLIDIETQYRHRRQAGGIAAAKERGAYKGRKRDTTKQEPQQAMMLRKRGLTLAQIASLLNIAERTVYRYLAKQSSESID